MIYIIIIIIIMIKIIMIVMNISLGLDEKDPRWLGAWWIGFPLLATLLLLFSGRHWLGSRD